MLYFQYENLSCASYNGADSLNSAPHRDLRSYLYIEVIATMMLIYEEVVMIRKDSARKTNDDWMHIIRVLCITLYVIIYRYMF